MMLKRTLFSLLLICWMAPLAFAQTTDIDDIQAYTDAGVPASPLNGLPVTIEGVITVPKGTYNGGTHYVQDATGGVQAYSSAAPDLAIGDRVSVSGTVGAYSGEIQISSPVFTFLDVDTAPLPLELTPSEALDYDGSTTRNAADYEIVGTLCAVTGNVAFLPGEEAPPWPLADGQGTFGLTTGPDTLIVFVDRTTLIDAASVGEGELYKVIAPMASYNGLLELKPRMQSDLIENPSDPYPVIADITPDPWTPELAEAVTVSATITDNSAITEAKLFYQYAPAKAFAEVAMTDMGGGIYQATIPGSSGGGIQYYLSTTDDNAQTTIVPGDAPASFQELAVGTTSIKEIQSNMTEGTDASIYVGQLVNVEAIVTVAPGELQTDAFSNYVVADASGGAWSGIYVYEGSGSNLFLRGDKVRISGYVDEYNGITELLPQRGDALELMSFDNTVPTPSVATTDKLDITEKYESCLVATFASTVMDTLYAGAEWMLLDAFSDSTIYVDPAPSVSYMADLGEEMYVTGLLDTRFGRNEIVPRSDDDITLKSTVGNDPISARRNAVITNVHPNPFNPSTKIDFEIPRKGMTELAIFNARGERVCTLINGEMDQGSHFRTWNGRDDSGHAVSSGVYYSRLRFEAKSISTKKMTLVQ